MSDPRAQAGAGLRVTGLRVRLGRRFVVDGVDFTARPAAVTVLLGPNGAGKSTVLKAVAGLLPCAGRLELMGHDAAALTPRARARLVGYVPQASALDAAVPVRDVVAQGRFAHGVGLFHRPSATEQAVVAAAMERTDVTGLADRPFDQLSQGERRRVLVARALASAAPILLLDEPTAALDVGHALALLEVLRRVAREGTAVVLVLHQLQEAAAVADHAVLLAAGRVAFDGTAGEVIAPGPVREIYGVEVEANAQFACRLPAREAP